MTGTPQFSSPVHCQLSYRGLAHQINEKKKKMPKSRCELRVPGQLPQKASGSRANPTKG